LLTPVTETRPGSDVSSPSREGIPTTPDTTRWQSSKRSVVFEVARCLSKGGRGAAEKQTGLAVGEDSEVPRSRASLGSRKVADHYRLTIEST